VHQPDAVLHRGAEQSPAAADLEAAAVELDRHYLGPGGDCFETRGERVPEIAIVNFASRSTADLILATIFSVVSVSILFLHAFAECLSCAGEARFHRMIAEPQYSRDFRDADFLDVLQ